MTMLNPAAATASAKNAPATSPFNAPLVGEADAAAPVAEPIVIDAADDEALCPRDGVAVAVALAARETSLEQVSLAGAV